MSVKDIFILGNKFHLINTLYENAYRSGLALVTPLRLKAGIVIARQSKPHKNKPQF
jgi:hypothetical protein